MPVPESPGSVVTIAKRLAEQFDLRGQDYALGGALALGYWAAPRGTVDVDVTVYYYVAPDQHGKYKHLEGKQILWDFVIEVGRRILYDRIEKE